MNYITNKVVIPMENRWCFFMEDQEVEQILPVVDFLILNFTE